MHLSQKIFMQRALQLAALGRGQVQTNPMVGAVVVNNGLIIGEGYHRQYGQAHAEVNAINMVLEKYGTEATELLKNSTVYVTLEPCNHFGKTPPCSHLLVNSKVQKVVVGCLDPFAEVNGKGIAYLRENGIEVMNYSELVEISNSDYRIDKIIKNKIIKNV